LIVETVYYDDIIKIHRKKLSKNEEESLIEDIEKDKHLEKEESPKEKIIEFVGDYLIEKRQKKKSKHKSVSV
jgi:glutamate/tyrosine decarboxylase-like PLP-dependent enzyme